MRREAILLGLVGLALGSGTVGWVASGQIRSPAEVAASSQPPEPSLITVPVERRLLTTSVVMRGEARPADVTNVRLAPALGRTLPIVTRLPVFEGDTIDQSDVIIEVAGRPVFVLEGDLPMFRRIGPGISGPDVEQLEVALVRLGLEPGAVDGVYDRETESAIEQLYVGAGYQPTGPSADDLAQVQNASERVSAAEVQLSNALEDVGGQLSDSDLLTLDLAVRLAEDSYNEAIRTRDRELASLAQALSDAEATELAAAAARDEANGLVSTARTGQHPVTGDPITATELDEFETRATQAAEALTAAERATQAVRDSEIGARELNARIIGNAELDLAIARTTRSERIAEAASADTSDSITRAQAELEAARSSLDQVQAYIGIVVPLSELVFLPRLPRVVRETLVEVGETPGDHVMAVSDSAVVVRATASADDGLLLKERMVGQLIDPAAGVRANVELASIAEDEVSDRFELEFLPAEDLPDALLERNLRLEVPIESSDGEVLSVPLAALTTGPDGSVRVDVADGDGTTRTVRVAVGVVARSEGLVEVEPLNGSLVDGDRVVVGSNFRVEEEQR